MSRVRSILTALAITSLLAVGPAPADAGGPTGTSDRAAGGPTWTVTDAPVVLRSNTMVSEVACSPTGTSCVAVGHRFDRDGEQVLAIQRWDGSAWRAETPPPGASADWVDVACSTPTDCVAIEDTSPPRGLTRRIAVRSAAGWRWVDFAVARRAIALSSVSCASAVLCMLSAFSGEVVTFDGATVRPLTRLPDTVVGAGGQALFWVSDLSCASSTYCVAVGGHAIVEWDGERWAATTLGDGELLDEVGCWAERACLVQSEDYLGRTESYSRSPAHTWAQVPSPPGRSVESLDWTAGLTCTMNVACHVVRYTGRRRAPEVQLATWGDQGWTTSAMPPPQGAVQALGCGPGECVVIDQVQSSPHGVPIRARALHGYGSAWSRQSMVNPRGVLLDSRPIEASCPSRDWCLAVGDAGDEEEYVVRWTGRRWTEMAAPLQSQWDVDCWQPGSCVAAGWHDKKPRIAVLRSGHWERPPAVMPAWLVEGSMTGVSCVESLCTYTGYYRARHGAGYGVFVARRGPGGWSAQRLGPLIEDEFWFHAFPSVDCPTVSHCVVVTSQLQPRRGPRGQVPDSYEAVLEDGTWQWRKVGHNFSLFDLDCADADHCVAGGSDGYPGLIMARGPDGRWRRVAAPTRNADFYSVSCPSSRECYVAGTGSRVRRLTRTPTGWRAHETGPHDMTDITCWAPRSCLTFDDRTARVSR